MRKAITQQLSHDAEGIHQDVAGDLMVRASDDRVLGRPS